MYDVFIPSVTKVLRERRRAGAKEFYITRDLKVDLVLMCTDEKDIAEVNESTGPCVGKGEKKDHGGFKKLMWCGMKEFNCHETSTWFRCGRAKSNGFHAQTTWKKKARMEGAARLHHRAQVEFRRSLHLH